MAEKNSDVFDGIAQGLKEAAAWQRGEIELAAVNIDPMPPKRIKAIRKRAAKSARAFEARYGIPAATLQNWEQGRRSPDAPSRVLLKAIELDPDFVERAARSA
jgi:putative transcriptional regulator